MSDPKMFAAATDYRLRKGECKTTFFPAGTKLVGTNLPPRIGSVELVTTELLNGLKGNQVIMSMEDCLALGLDIDSADGRPTDVVFLTQDN